MRDLGTLGGTYSFAEALNDKGEVIGGANTADDQAFHAFLWKRGTMTDLGTVAGDGCSFALSINSKGQVVGQSFECFGGAAHAFLWEKGGPAIDLNTLVPAGAGMTLTTATFIGEGGEITGQAVLDTGEEHAFLLIPGEEGKLPPRARRRRLERMPRLPRRARRARLAAGSRRRDWPRSALVLRTIIGAQDSGGRTRSTRTPQTISGRSRTSPAPPCFLAREPPEPGFPRSRAGEKENQRRHR